MPITTGTALLIAGGVTAGVTIYRTQQAKKAGKRAVKAGAAMFAKQEKLAKQMQRTELQAGEYFEELKTQQMELQAQASNIYTLADLISSRREAQPAPKIFTMPAAKTYTPVERINRAISDLFRGG